MTSMADWPVVPAPMEDAPERRFFTGHEWDTIEAATARIIPTDSDPGAREAGAVRFIDRYLSGIDFIYAAADGSGFLRMSGPVADAWRARVERLQQTYREGVRRLDDVAREQAGAAFVELSEEDQDKVLEIVSGAPKPVPVELSGSDSRGIAQMASFDDGLDFFSALATHTRQGFYSDPVYGGNRDHVGWRVIGFPGPRSLKDTMDGTFTTEQDYVLDYDWLDLLPHMRNSPWPVPDTEGPGPRPV
jgi:gluconate 2-dehydrogenase gamma chain